MGNDGGKEMDAKDDDEDDADAKGWGMACVAGINIAAGSCGNCASTMAAMGGREDGG